MEIDIGDLCTHCGRDTASDDELLYVNRIPCGADGKLVLVSGGDVTIDVEINGYMCVECQSIPCDRCGTPTHEYEILDKATPELVCSSCLKESENDLVQR